MDNQKIKVLYIAGNGRSGSTILHNILGQIDGFFAIGELRYIWERGIVKNRLCGCGMPFHDCHVWQAIMENAYGGMQQINAREMSEQTESFRIQNLPLTWIPPIRQKEIDRLQAYTANLEKLYRAIQTTTGSRVIVDSSKNPSYGYILQTMPALELYVLHFMRDSRAVAYSWTKKKQFQPGDNMARKTPVKSALQWNVRNLSAEMFLMRKPDRHMTLRYEDFVANPEAAVASIVSLVQENSVQLPFVDPHTAELQHANHSVFGNPVRFQQGEVTIRLDNKWQTKLNQRQKFAVTGLTWPLQLKYGYLRPFLRTAKKQVEAYDR